jgi:hypothetical protein
MTNIARTLFTVSALCFATLASAQVTLHENENFEGRSFTARQRVQDLQRMGFNDRASSIVVTSERWQVCENLNQRGRCMVLRPGKYPSLASMRLEERIRSVRQVRPDEQVSDSAYAPMPGTTPEKRRRRGTTTQP